MKLACLVLSLGSLVGACAVDLDTTEPVSTVSSNIVGGSATTIDQRPWQVLLTRHGDTFGSFNYICGGAILNPSWIITAQHCVDGETLPPKGDSDYRIVAGATDRTQQQNAQVRTVYAIARWPGYTLDNVGNIAHHDIALLNVFPPLDLSGPNAQPIPLVTALDVSRGATNLGAIATVSGWGTMEGGSLPNVLRQVDVPIVANNSFADEIQAGASDGKDSCGGDSGGPLTVVADGHPKLAGLVSYGSGSCGSSPGAYTRVSTFADWATEVSSSVVSYDINQSAISGSANTFTRIGSIYVPYGAATLSVLMTDYAASVNQNADLYVRYGGWPTATAYSCKPGRSSSREACTYDAPSEGYWYVSVRGTSQAFSNIDVVGTVVAGVGGLFKPAPADYDNDGATDIAVKYDSGQWRVDLAWNGFGSWDAMYVNYGNNSARPVPGDYDGDGRTDLAVLVPDFGGYNRWYIDYAIDGLDGWDWSGWPYGTSTAVPVPGRYDGDTSWDIAYKTAGGMWAIDFASNGFNQSGQSYDIAVYGYGGSTAIPVPADYNNDGRMDLAIKNSLGEYNIDYSMSGGYGEGLPYGFGQFQTYLTGRGDANWKPAPGNFDGYFGADVAALDNYSGTFYFDYSEPGPSFDTTWNYWLGGYGTTGTPMIADYNNDAYDDLGVLYPNNVWCIDLLPQPGWDWCVPIQ